MNNTTGNKESHNNPKQPEYIAGVGWRYATEHRMTRWPEWKDSRLPGTYMFTLNVNGGQHLLGRLEGSSLAVRNWMKSHPMEVQAASDDELYYRHALLGDRAMPFVLKAGTVKTVPNKDGSGSALTAQSSSGSGLGSALTSQSSSGSGSALISQSGSGSAELVHRRFNDGALSTGRTGPAASSSPSGKRRKTHFPIEALRQPDAPHIVLTPLGEKVHAAWLRMPTVMPQIEQVTLAIMPNHIHAIIAVRRELPKAIGAVIRSFMGVTSHFLHQMISSGEVSWDASRATVTKKSSADKPSLWEQGFCIGVCQTEAKLHTRIGYVMENPFFGVLEKEEKNLMQRALSLTVAGRKYHAYGNMFLLKEPDRIQVFCHRRHPVTGEPYHLTQDFVKEKVDIMNAVGNGAVVVTPGISPGESDIMWSVLRAGGSVINIQKEAIPLSDRWHPEKERRLYCSQGRMLVLAVHDLPSQVFHDRWGIVIPSDSKYARFHLLNLVAEEICTEGIEHSSFRQQMK